jgi:hypothetical protein
MSVKRSRPGRNPVRRGKAVGPDYPEGRFAAPWNADLGGPFGSHDEKDVFSEAGVTFEGGGAPLTSGNYDALWNGK